MYEEIPFDYARFQALSKLPRSTHWEALDQVRRSGIPLSPAAEEYWQKHQPGSKPARKRKTG